jgi:hypothetical protein
MHPWPLTFITRLADLGNELAFSLSRRSAMSPYDWCCGGSLARATRGRSRYSREAISLPGASPDQIGLLQARLPARSTTVTLQ